MLHLSHCCWQRSIKTLLNLLSRRAAAACDRTAVNSGFTGHLLGRSYMRAEKCLRIKGSQAAVVWSWQASHIGHGATPWKYLWPSLCKRAEWDYHLWFSFTIFGFSSLSAHRRFHQPTTRRFVFTRLPQISWKRCCCSVVLGKMEKGTSVEHRFCLTLGHVWAPLNNRRLQWLQNNHQQPESDKPFWEIYERQRSN